MLRGGNPVDGVGDEISRIELPVEAPVELLAVLLLGIDDVDEEDVGTAVKAATDAGLSIADVGRVGCAKWRFERRPEVEGGASVVRDGAAVGGAEVDEGAV